MAGAMAWPCPGPSRSVRRINRSRVPWSSSTRCFCSLVDILGDDSALPVECQGEHPASCRRVPGSRRLLEESAVATLAPPAVRLIHSADAGSRDLFAFETARQFVNTGALAVRLRQASM